MLSPFLISLLKTIPPTPTSLSWHSSTLGCQTFTGSRSSSLIDVQQCHPLLRMRLESWVSQCTKSTTILFGWWFSLWDLWGYWLIHIVVPSMTLQTC